MDVAYPYAEDASRRQLLYRLPSAPLPRRLLIVGGDADLVGPGWGGPVSTATPEQLVTLPGDRPAAFEAVALPMVLGLPRRPGPGPAQQLGGAWRRLVPGGVVVGHVAQRLTLRRMARVGGMVAAAQSMGGTGALGSADDCTAALRRAGFVDPECYYVVPGLDAPMGLIPCHAAAARAQFLRATRASQGHFHPLAYAARLLLAHLGLGGMQQSHLFFWARKPC
jgi:hypothetical protein